MAHEQQINLHQSTGGACRKLPGPCPHTVCRFNLTSERRDNRGAKPAEIRLPVVRESCALEAAELGGMTLEEIASRLSITRERVRQIQLGALTKVWLHLGRNHDLATASTVGKLRRPRIAA
jgi:Sigma-70, region 4